MPYQRVKNVAWRRIGDETVIVNLDRRRMLALNEAGGAVWDAFAAEAGGGAAATRHMPRDDQWAPGEDVAHFLADLEHEGVIERCEDGGEADGDSVGDPFAIPLPQVSVPPAVVGREELQRFGGSCALLPVAGGICDQTPWGS